MVEVRLDLSDYTFVYLDDIDPRRSRDGTIEALTPQQEYKDANSTFVHKYGWGPFCRFSIAPDQQFGAGVYAICCGDKVRYIGKSQDVESRFNQGYGVIYPRNCFQGGQETNCRINTLIRECATQGGSVSVFIHETTNRDTLEKKLIEEINPPWNRQGGSPATTQQVSDRKSSTHTPEHESKNQEEYDGKYSPLKDFLRTIEKDEIELSFSEIEGILGFNLPQSAQEFPAWWGNGSQRHSYAWLDVGWKVDDLDQSDKNVRYKRT